MITEALKSISLRGRIVYAIMCAEKYASTKFPSNAWKLVFKPFWEICESETWDEWSDKVLEYIPEILLEFDSYESSDFDYLPKSEYEQIRKLFKTTNKNVNTILYNIRKIELAYSYSSISGIGKESLDIIEEIVKILEKEKIELPDPQRVAFSKFSEKNGWGEPFDGKGLSIILKIKNDKLLEQMVLD